jgi:HSP20 family protein
MPATWRPWQDLFDLQHEMSDLLQQSFGAWNGPSSGAPSFWSPPLDVFSRDGDLVVRAELPGIDPEKDVDITVQNGYLTMSGERRQENTSNGDSFYRTETYRGSFRRHVALPEGVQADDIKASYQDGILQVVVPKAAELSAPKRIPISTGTRRKALTAKGTRK